MGEGMKYLVSLKRKNSMNAFERGRKIREEVSASDEKQAKEIALKVNGNHRYFVVESVRRV